MRWPGEPSNSQSSHPGDETLREPQVLHCDVQDDPPGRGEPVEPTAVVEESTALAVPQTVVLDRQLQLRTGEVEARDEALEVEDAVLGDGSQAGPMQDQADPGFLR